MKLGEKKERRKVLLVKFRELGGVAMTVPAVYDASIANPDVEFYFLTRHHEAELFINTPPNLTVLPVNLDNFSGFGGMRRLASGLQKRYGITHMLDLQSDRDSMALRFLMRLKGVGVYGINNGDRAKRELTRPHNKVLVQLKPQTHRDREVFYKAGIALANDFDTVWGKDKGDPELFRTVSGTKQPGEHWLAVAPFARYRGKVYPLDQTERVIEYFSKRPGEKIFVLGYGDEECGKISKLANRYPGVVNMAAADLGLAAELALLSHCDVMLSMDAANMHLASLVGLRVVSVWGATHPYTGFMGWRQRTRDVVQLDMTCRPCSVSGDRPCLRGDYHCLAGITPKMVIDRLLGC